MNITWLAIDVAQYSNFMIFYLLYLRVRIFKNTLLSQGFDNAPVKKYSPRKYMQMYEAILDFIEDTDYPVKCMQCLCLVCSMPRLVTECFQAVTELKENLSSDERERSELQLVLRIMKQRPLQYTLWRAIPFTLRVICSFVSFLIINVMAVVQIRFYI
ncbi:uncharacterized protein LOC142982974 [Anticarsia gemmatalis]|uniref:uncharacterized protein LOC142982974 n=1 Tax=Anticarsia gemmatalis TaxID=129554 RepID=UPI003F772F60